MRKLGRAFAVTLAVVVGLAQCPAYAQDADAYAQASGLIMALQASENSAMGATLDHLVDTQQYLAAADMEYARARKWHELADKIWQSWLGHPSVSVSILWEAAVTRAGVWASMARREVYLAHRLNDVAEVEDRTFTVKYQQFWTLMRNAETAEADAAARGEGVPVGAGENAADLKQAEEKYLSLLRYRTRSSLYAALGELQELPTPVLAAPDLKSEPKLGYVTASPPVPFTVPSGPRWEEQLHGAAMGGALGGEVAQELVVLSTGTLTNTSRECALLDAFAFIAFGQTDTAPDVLPGLRYQPLVGYRASSRLSQLSQRTRFCPVAQSLGSAQSVHIGVVAEVPATGVRAQHLMLSPEWRSAVASLGICVVFLTSDGVVSYQYLAPQGQG